MPVINLLATNIGIGTSGPNAVFQIDSTAASELFVVNDNGAGDTSRFIIGADGNVGIGTAFTNNKLVIGSGDIQIVSGSGALAFSNNAGNGVELRANNTEVTFNGLGGGVSNVMTVERGGNIGIGTIIPRSLIEIQKGSGTAQMTIDGTTGACFMLQDTDGAGWTECDVLNGTMSCSTDIDGICD